MKPKPDPQEVTDSAGRKWVIDRNAFDDPDEVVRSMQQPTEHPTKKEPMEPKPATHSCLVIWLDPNTNISEYAVSSFELLTNSRCYVLVDEDEITRIINIDAISEISFAELAE